MGKASPRKKERRSIAPAIHSASFDREPGSAMTAPLDGKNTTLASICGGQFGLISHGSSVNRVEIQDQESQGLIATPDAHVHRSTIVKEFKNPTKKAQEKAIGRIFAKGRSAISGRIWHSNSDLPEYSDVDIELSAEGEEPVYAQLTRAQPSDSWELKLSEQYETWHTMPQVSDEILNAIQQKVDHFPERKHLVLVLDSYILPLPEAALRRVCKDYSDVFRKAEFQEIWYISLQPATVTKLYPDFISVDIGLDLQHSQTISEATATGFVRFKRPGSEEWEYVSHSMPHSPSPLINGLDAPGTKSTPKER